MNHQPYRIIWILAFCIGSAVFTGRAWAEAPSGSGPSDPSLQDSSKAVLLDYLRQNDLTQQPEIRDHLAQWKSSAESGNLSGANRELEEIESIKKRLDTRNLLFVTRYLMAEGQQLISKGKSEPALQAFSHAVRLSPNDWEAKKRWALEVLRTHPAQAAAVIGALSNAVLETGIWKHPLDSLSAFTLLSLIPALLFGGLVYLAILSVIQFPLLAHDVGEFFSLGDSKWLPAVPVVLVLLVPLAVGGPALFLVAVPVVFSLYLRRNARIAVIVLLGILFCVPNLNHWQAGELVVKRSNIMLALEGLRNDSWDVTSVSTLLDELGKHPNDPLLMFSMGLIEKKRGNYQAAEAYYRKLLEKNPTDVRAMVNLGNLLFIQSDFKGAVGSYDRAIGVDPNLVEAHYNLSSTYGELLEVESKEKEFNKAKGIDIDKTLAFFQHAGDSLASKVVDMNLDEKEIARFQEHFQTGWSRFQDSLWKPLFGGMDQERFQLVCLGAFALCVGGFLLRNRWGGALGHSLYCSSCGTVYREPQAGEHEKVTCSQCLALSFKRYPIEPKIREEKLRKIRRYFQKRTSRFNVLNLVFPGAGYVYEEFYVLGMVLVLGTSLFLVRIGISAIEGLFNPGFDPAGCLLSNSVWIVPLVVYYLLVNTVIRSRIRSH